MLVTLFREIMLYSYLLSHVPLFSLFAEFLSLVEFVVSFLFNRVVVSMSFVFNNNDLM